MKPSATLFYDLRKPRKDETYPVRIRLYFDGKYRHYKTGFNLTKDVIKNIQSGKVKAENRETRKKLFALESKADNVINNLGDRFTFDLFERKFLRKSSDAITLSGQYAQFIKDLSPSQVGTINAYNQSLTSLLKFVKYRKQKSVTLKDITPKWLDEYERFMLDIDGKSRTTIGVYLRALRAVYNKAIFSNDITEAYYPFSRNKNDRRYSIPSTRKTKRALTKDQIKVLYECKPDGFFQQRAKDFFFFSYLCNGMNMKDIAQLKYSDIKDDSFEFYRAKTINTSREDLRPIRVLLNKQSKMIISRYGLNDKSGYVFDIISDDLNDADKGRKIKHFTRNVNENLKELAKENGLPGEISTMWARHSFATLAIRQGGVNLEFVQESLGHKKLETTQNYFAGFEDDVKKEVLENLLNFE